MREVLSDFLSGDGYRIWAASGAVMASRDREGLRALAAEEGAIRAAVEGVDLGGALRPNATHLSFALRKIAFATGDACFCALYPTYDMFDPDREGERGYVTRLRGQVDGWTAEDWVRCTDCGQVFHVRSELGGHYPTSRWTPVAAD